MKNSKLKLLAMLLIGSMIFSGCGKSSKKNNDGKNDKEEQVTEEVSDGESEEDQEVNSEPLEYRLVESKDDIDKNAYKLYLKDSAKLIEEQQTDVDECDNVHTGDFIEDGFEDSFAHKNFDSYDFVGVVVTPVNYEGHGNAVNFVYKLNFSCHGEVSTYCSVVYFDVYTNIKEVEHGAVMSSVSDVAEYEYFGKENIEDLFAELQDDLNIEGTLQLDEEK